MRSNRGYNTKKVERVIRTDPSVTSGVDTRMSDSMKNTLAGTFETALLIIQMQNASCSRRVKPVYSNTLDYRACRIEC